MQSRTPIKSLNEVSDWVARAGTAHYRSADLAALCGVTVRTLERYFREQWNTSPQRWLDELRLRRAGNLAVVGARTKELANQLGYKQPSHFCRHFKRRYGVPVKMWKMGVRAEAA